MVEGIDAGQRPQRFETRDSNCQRDGWSQTFVIQYRKR